MIEFHPDRAAKRADRQLRVQPAVLDAHVVEHPQGLAGEVAEFGMVPLGFQFGDDHDRQNYLVLIETCDGGRVGEQDAGVEYIRTATLRFDHADSLGRRGQPGTSTGHRRVGWAGTGPRRAAPALLSSRLRAEREA